MRLGSLARLVGLGLRRDLRGLTLSLLGVAAGVGALLFFLAAGLGTGELLRNRILPVDASLIEVVPPQVSLGLFGRVEIDESKVEELAALPGVEAAHRKMRVRVPAVSRFDGNFFGKRLRMGVEIVAEGVEPGFLGAIEGFHDSGEGVVPVVVSPRLLEIYNESFARERGMPRLGERLLVGFEFPLELGRSFMGEGHRERLGLHGRVVGFSDRAMLQGITIPLDVARRLNQRFGEDASHYSAVVLRAADPGQVPAIAEAVRGLGLEIDDSERKLAQRVGFAVALATGMLSLLGLFICALASVNIALSLGASVRSRAREFGIFRAVGATSGDIAALVLGEALVVGGLGGILGVGGALGLSRAADALFAAHLPAFPFKPESFFSFPAWLLLLGFMVGLLAALLGALAPVRRAVRLDPARILA